MMTVRAAGGGGGGGFRFVADNQPDIGDKRQEGIMREILRLKEETLKGLNLSRSSWKLNLQVYANRNQRRIR